MAHVFGIPVGSVLFYVFYLYMFATVFVSVIYYFEKTKQNKMKALIGKRKDSIIPIGYVHIRTKPKI